MGGAPLCMLPDRCCFDAPRTLESRASKRGGGRVRVQGIHRLFSCSGGEKKRENVNINDNFKTISVYF
jgi:hypothetical protein